jgi:asparagine synthase (glutamine-hydrolysing)
MCGIAGAVGGRLDVRLSATRAMIDSMVHRGPDSAGTTSVGEATLGMCQLAIREPASRSVPLVGRDDLERVLAYNGEVYAGFWPTAGARGPVVPASVDQEVEAILSQLSGMQPPDGMFALATSRAREPGVTCLRDAFGIKPLYFRRTMDTTFFASEVRALCGVDAAPTLRREAIVEFLLYGRCLEHRTFYQEIASAAPGARLTIGPGKVEVNQRQPSYWRAPRADAGVLRAAITQAVRATIISERRLGLALSGGLDSTILAAELSLLGVEDLHTFSVRVEGSSDGCDDLASLGLPGGAWKTWTHHVVPFGPQRFADGLRRSVELAAEPTRMTSFPLYLALAEAVSAAGVVVLLCGEGADELFGGYGSYRKWLGKHRGITLPELADYACPAEKEARLRALLGDAVVSATRRAFDEQFRECVNQHPFDGLRKLEQYLRLEPLLHRTDLALMAHSIEGRVPFLHGHVPELAYGLPLSDCLSEQATKTALRRAYEQLIPARARKAPKTNFRAPVARWFAGELAPWVREQMSAFEPALAEQGLELGAVRGTVVSATAGDSHAAAMTFALLALGMFLGRNAAKGRTHE